MCRWPALYISTYLPISPHLSMADPLSATSRLNLDLRCDSEGAARPLRRHADAGEASGVGSCGGRLEAGRQRKAATGDHLRLAAASAASRVGEGLCRQQDLRSGAQLTDLRKQQLAFEESKQLAAKEPRQIRRSRRCSQRPPSPPRRMQRTPPRHSCCSRRAGRCCSGRRQSQAALLLRVGDQSRTGAACPCHRAPPTPPPLAGKRRSLADGHFCPGARVRTCAETAGGGRRRWRPAERRGQSSGRALLAQT